jgi:hypothetical protein
MVPQAAPAHPVPERVQLTAVFVVPVTVAVNCLVALTGTLAAVGETDTATTATVMVAVPVLLASAEEVAVMVTVPAVAGGVYVVGLALVLEKLPQLPAGAQLHVTPVLEEPDTVAVIEVPAAEPAVTVAVAGETETLTVFDELDVFLSVPHPNNAARRITIRKACRARDLNFSPLDSH